MSISAFLKRPDVRADPIRLLSRRIRLAAYRHAKPGQLSRRRTFRLTNGCLVRTTLDDVVGRGLYTHGTFEYEALAAWLAALSDGAVAVDVGAHIGTFTLAAAQVVGPSGRVLAFEPNPQNRQGLVENLRLNGLSHRVTVFDCALSDREELVSIGSPDPRNSGMSRLGVGHQEVKTRRLDDILAELRIGSVAAMKIDVEGHELQVLRGSSRSLDHIETLVIEVNGEDAMTYLRERGFTLRLPSGEPYRAEIEHREDGEALNVVAKALTASPK